MLCWGNIGGLRSEKRAMEHMEIRSGRIDRMVCSVDQWGLCINACDRDIALVV